MCGFRGLVTFGGEGSRVPLRGFIGMHQMHPMHDSWMMDQWMDGAALDRRMAVDWSEWRRTRSVVAPRDTSIDHSVCVEGQIVEARFVYRSGCGMDVRYEVMQVRLMTTCAIGTEYLVSDYIICDYMYATHPFLINK